MVTPLNTKLSDSFALDTNKVGDLKRAARENSPEALKATAQQFEALFMNNLLKSMREATPKDGMFDNEQTKMYTSMLDQQLSQTMSSKGIGLADVLTRQLSNYIDRSGAAQDIDGTLAKPFELGERPAGKTATATAGPAAEPVAGGTKRKSSVSRPAHVQAFQEKLGAHAAEASRSTGIPAKFMLGQAALESGWGKREIVGADGSRSHNLFGIKAGASWKGKTVTTTTTEYVNGVPQTKLAKFRAYDSYAEAFSDYASLLKNNPRYKNVIANSQDAVQFAHGLQKAGYATDPHYGAKLARIINTSLSA